MDFPPNRSIMFETFLPLYNVFYVCLVQKISPTHITPILLKTPPLPSILINFSIAIIVNMAKRGTKSAPDPADDCGQTLELPIKRGRKKNDSKASKAVVMAAVTKTASAAIEAKTTTDAVVPAGCSHAEGSWASYTNYSSSKEASCVSSRIYSNYQSASVDTSLM